MNDAFRIAKTGRPGPVVVDLPMDVQKESVDVLPDFQSYTKQNLLIPDVSVINKIIDLLCLAKKPLIMGAAIKMTGQVSVFRNDLDDMPCYNCLYGGSYDCRLAQWRSLVYSFCGKER